MVPAGFFTTRSVVETGAVGSKVETYRGGFTRSGTSSFIHE
jgi:hypothetical protein